MATPSTTDTSATGDTNDKVYDYLTRSRALSVFMDNMGAVSIHCVLAGMAEQGADAPNKVALWMQLMDSRILAEYHIAFHDYSKALIGALILSKVVLIMEHVPLGSWVRSQPAWLAVILRTILYSLGVLVVLILEKGFEGRHEHGSFGGAADAAFRGTNAPHVWSTLICVTGALLVWNAANVVKRHLGKRGFAKLFLTPLPAEPVDRTSPPSR